MPQASLTAAFVERQKPPRTGQVEYFDRRLPSFGLRISYRGTKAWFVTLRLSGKLVRITLGRYPAITLADARQRARAVMRSASEGKDPRREREEAERERQRRQRDTFAACAALFLEQHAAQRLRVSTQREYRRVLCGPDTLGWQGRSVADITKQDVLEVIGAIETRGSPGAAKRTLVYLRKFFSWCADRDLVAEPPTYRIRPPHPEVKRDRVLSRPEVSEVLAILAHDSSVFAPAIRLLLLTGQRRSEVAGMRWTELRDFEAKDTALWEIPGERTKNKLTHLVPLSNAVRRLIAVQPRSGDFVFSTTGRSAVSGFGKAKQRLDRDITASRVLRGLPPLPAWTLHDLRRTMVTVMNEKLAILPHVVEAVVNHVSGLAKAGVAGVYNRALYLSERRQALQRWSDYVEELERDLARAA